MDDQSTTSCEQACLIISQILSKHIYKLFLPHMLPSRLICLLCLGVCGLAIMSPLSRDTLLTDFQANTAVLFTSSTNANLSTSSNTYGNYRNETFFISFANAIDTTNRIQYCVGIIKNYFDYSGTIVWGLSITSNTSTNMNIHAFVNGTNKVTDISISYVVSTNLNFDIGYYTKTFAVGDNVVSGGSTSCGFGTGTQCRNTDVTVPYNTGVVKDTTKGLDVKVFVVGISYSRSSGQDIGFIVNNINPAASSFNYTAVAIATTSINSLSIYYIAFQKTTITTDVTYKLYAGDLSTGCWDTNGGCSGSWSPPDTKQINNAGPVWTPYCLIYGVSKLYSAAGSGDTGNFYITLALNSNNYTASIYFTGNNNNPIQYQSTFSYLIFQHVSCASYGIDKYMTLNRQNCNATCSAWIGEYADTNNYCQACGPLCYSCNAVPTTCTACYTSQKRILVSGGLCNCSMGYYDDFINTVCQACHYSCETCTGATFSNCITCDLTAAHRLLSTNTCPCIAGYYDNGGTICLACHYSCTTCSGSSNATCLTCDSTTNRRYLSGGYCLCNPGYYNNSVAICAACSYQCLTCNGSSNSSCMTCNTAGFRSLTGTSCPCSVGYYDQGPTISTCGVCHPSCYTCNGPLNTNCLTCNISLFRSIVLNRCDCITHYYQIGGVCTPCDYTCENCTGGSNAQCSSCISLNNRALLSTSCPCNTGYLDIGLTACVACSYTCLTCSGSSTFCMNCNTTNHRTLAGSTCPCDPGYVDTLASMCSTCHYSCKTCTSVLTTGCTTCEADRVLSGAQCLCLTNTYDNGLTEPCLPCHYTCQNCSGAYSTSCTSCDASKNRTFSLNSCPCNTYTYDTGLAACQPCSYQCYTCSVTASNCTTCNPAANRVISGTTCVCAGHYYQNNVEVCPMCLATCLNCSSYSVCTACDSLTNHRTLVSGSCICQDGYFETGATVCASCSYSCLTCTSSSTYCLSCNSSAYRVLGSATCNCITGYVDTGVTTCSKCHYSCVSCTGGTASFNCLTCNATALRTVSGTSCVCPAGYYDDGAQQQCQPCYYKCKTCSSYSICTSCETTLNRTLSLSNCNCITGYYDSGSALCNVCHYSCLSCNGALSTNCLTCSAALSRSFSSYSCLCNSGFYEASVASCSACNSSCLTCSGTATNCTSCRATDNRYFVNNRCVCLDGFFDNGGATCVACNSKCMTCTGSSTNCLSCNATQLTILSGNICICQSTAYLNATNNVCYACSGYCLTCTSNTNTSCLSCISSTFRTLFGSTCLCNPGYYQDSVPICSACHSSCATCIGGNTQYNCTSCVAGKVLMTSECVTPVVCTNYYFDGNCVDVCPNISYPNAGTCTRCINNCYTCASATYCLTCNSGYFFQPTNNTCVSGCAARQYNDSGACKSCPIQCQTCLLNLGNLICTSCNVSYKFWNNSCVQTCPVSTTVQVLDTCKPCIQPCLTCYGLNSYQCYSCKSGYWLEGTACVKSCALGQFANSLTLKCDSCPVSCIKCEESTSQLGVAECIECQQPYYSSMGQCIAQNYFLSNSKGLVKCHPNCKTCTGQGFSSCIKCQPMRGDQNNMAIRGYCECRDGSVQVGQGVCDKSMYNTIKTANSYVVSGSTSVFTATFAMGLLTSNFLNCQKFISYNQMMGQLFYMNASIPIGVGQTLKTLGKSNFGNYFSKASSDVTRRRILFTNSTQALDSVFLNQGSSSLIFFRCFHVILATVLVWITIIICTLVSKKIKNTLNVRRKHDLGRTYKKVLKTIMKICDLILKYLFFGFIIKILSLTCTEVSFSVMVNLKISSFSSALSISDFVVSLALGLYYLIMIIFLIRTAVKADHRDQTSPYSWLFSNYDIDSPLKWRHLMYMPFSVLRCVLLQVSIVMLASNPFNQSLSCTIIQVFFMFYTVASNPYRKPYSILVLLSQLILTCQMVTMTVLCIKPETDRISAALALIWLNYVQLVIFGLFCLTEVLNLVYKACKEWREQRRILPEIISQQSVANFSNATSSNLEKIVTKQSLHEIMQPDVIEEPEKEQPTLKKRYRVQKKVRA